jgi:hypothetical protein
LAAPLAPLMGGMKTALAAAVLLAGLATASAQQPPRLAAADIAVVMSAYVDSVVELRQFYVACLKDPADWDAGSELLVGSLEAEGLAAASASDLSARLAASGTRPANYDCNGAVAAARREIPQPKDWPSFHAGMLERVGIKPVVPNAPEDPRLAAVRDVFAKYIPQQTTALNCTALIQVEWFPQSYADWDGLVAGAAAAIAAAGFDAQTVQALVGPARAAQLMQPVEDRQAAITACIGDTRWMNWLGSFAVYSLPSDVEKALGGAQ